MQIRADHHRPFGVPVDASEKKVVLPEIRLDPQTRFHGRVVDHEDQPLPGALVSFDDGSVCVTANEQGAFVCEQRERAAEALVVSSPGFGSREIVLDRLSEADVSLGAVQLAKGQRLALRITRPDREVPLKITLLLDSKERYEHAEIHSRDLDPGVDSLRFEDVAPGDYLILIEGSAPAERLAVPVVVEDGKDEEKEITVAPYRLEGTATFGGEPIQEGDVSIIGLEHTWRHGVPIRDGQFTAILWQPGELSGFVKSPETGTGKFVRSPDLGEDPSRWDISIPRRLIAGRVTDSETGEPVRNASIRFTAVTGRSRGYSSAKVEQDGKYQILAAEAGTYTLRVISPEHVAVIRDVTVTDDEAVMTVDFALDRGVVQELAIVAPTGAPIPGAIVLEGIQSDRVNPEIMTSADASGIFRLRGQPGETRLLYIIPQSGSFTVARLTLPRSSDESEIRQIVVPSPAGALRVRTVDADGNRKRSWLLVRHDGEFVPYAILRFVTRDPATDESGEVVLSRLPAGMYEIWGLIRREEEPGLVASGGTLRKPERVGVSTGEAAVTVVVP